MQAVPKRGLNLLRPDLMLLGHPVQQNPEPVFTGAELLEPIDQPVRIANGRDVGIGHEVDRVCRKHRRVRSGTGNGAGVDDDEVVGACQQLKQLLDGRRVVRTGAIDLIPTRQDVQAGFMLHHQLAQELLVDSVEVVERVDQGESRPDAKKQRYLAQELMQINDERRPLGQARDLDGAVDGQGGRARSTLRAKK